MFTLSTFSFIFILQLCVVFIVLFIIWFVKHRNIRKKLNDNIIICAELEQKITDFKNLKTTSEIIDQELIYNREAIDDHFSDENTHDIAETYEFRSAYLQLEKKWLIDDNKNATYWDEIYQQLKQLFIDAVIINKSFSDDGVSGELKKRSNESENDDSNLEQNQTTSDTNDNSENEDN